MKYVRKISALLIGIIFFAAVVISLGMIFAVRNINVTMVTYADDCTESYKNVKKSLDVFKGDSIVFLNESSIKEAVSDSNCTVVSCEKKFPCTVNVTIKERLETFAVLVGGIYSMYDSDGKLLRSSVENVNINDGSPNVELTGVIVENIAKISEIAFKFKDKFKAFRSLVASVSLDERADIEDYTDKLSFNLRCGLRIQLDNYTERTEEKLAAVYTQFCKLTDREKLGGTLRGYENVIGDVKSDYKKSGS